MVDTQQRDSQRALASIPGKNGELVRLCLTLSQATEQADLIQHRQSRSGVSDGCFDWLSHAIAEILGTSHQIGRAHV